MVTPPQSPPAAVPLGKDGEPVDTKQKGKKKDDDQKREDEGRR